MWDRFFRDGWVVVFRVATVLVQLVEPRIVGSDFETTANAFKGIARGGGGFGDSGHGVAEGDRLRLPPDFLTRVDAVPVDARAAYAAFKS